WLSIQFFLQLQLFGVVGTSRTGGTHIEPAAGDGADRAYQFLAGAVRRKAAGRAAAHQLQRVELFGPAVDDQYRQTLPSFLEGEQRFIAVAARGRDVQQHDVRPQLVGHAHAVSGGGRFADDVQVRFRRQPLPYAGPHDGEMFDD